MNNMENLEEIFKQEIIKWVKNDFENVTVLANRLANITKEEFAKSTIVTYAQATPIKCDACGCHPNVLIITEFGTFCQEHAKYVKDRNLSTI